MSSTVPPRTVRVLAGGKPWLCLQGCPAPLERIRERVMKYARRHGDIEIREELPINISAPGHYDALE